jgi:hypothetical protein
MRTDPRAACANEKEALSLLAKHYRWTPADVKDVEVDTQANPDLGRYWIVLANAIRAGYEQTPENGFIRLQAWCAQRGLPDPFIDDCARHEKEHRQ